MAATVVELDLGNRCDIVEDAISQETELGNANKVLLDLSLRVRRNLLTACVVRFRFLRGKIFLVKRIICVKVRLITEGKLKFFGLFVGRFCQLNGLMRGHISFGKFLKDRSVHFLFLNEIFPRVRRIRLGYLKIYYFLFAGSLEVLHLVDVGK